MIYKVKVLIGDEPDALIQIYIDRAVISIKNYLNNDRLTNEYIIENFEEAVISIAEGLHKNKDSKNIKSMSQGKRSVTYTDDNGSVITEEISRLLPSPYVRMM